MNPFRWRKMTWLILIFTGLMLAWMIAGARSTSCSQYAAGSPERAGCGAGTGIGVGLIFGLWFVGFVVLSIIWFMTRPARRICPVCGNEVRKGKTVCKKCGYNFAAAAVHR